MKTAPVSNFRGTLAAITAVTTLAACASDRAGRPGSPTRPKMTTDTPAEITTPDSVETRLGTLRFTDGFPDEATVARSSVPWSWKPGEFERVN